MSSVSQMRILSGMRPTGRMHLGHYHGVLKNWIRLQHEYDCYFVAVDWHALTTNYAEPLNIQSQLWDMVIDWLAVGINPNAANIFIQSWVPEHAELHLLLSMITPLGWLERVPTYKDQQEKLRDKDLSTFGFLGYPCLQSADILLYKAQYVPVGEDQISHIEFAREIARRFNHIYGREKGFEALCEAAIKKMGKKNETLYRELRRAFQEQGDRSALETAQALLGAQQNISLTDRERLFGYLEGTGKIILPEPEAMLSETPRVVGIDGQKMSKSYHNTISLRETDPDISQKIRTMPTDPARVKRSDPGTPEKCPVWDLHRLYADDALKAWVQEGCTTAGIGCLECKAPVIEAIQKQVAPIREAAKGYEDNMSMVKNIVREGSEAAREQAKKTMIEVREAIGLNY